MVYHISKCPFKTKERIDEWRDECIRLIREDVTNGIYSTYVESNLITHVENLASVFYRRISSE